MKITAVSGGGRVSDQPEDRCEIPGADESERRVWKKESIIKKEKVV